MMLWIEMMISVEIASSICGFVGAPWSRAPLCRNRIILLWLSRVFLLRARGRQLWDGFRTMRWQSRELEPILQYLNSI